MKHLLHIHYVVARQDLPRADSNTVDAKPSLVVSKEKFLPNGSNYAVELLFFFFFFLKFVALGFCAGTSTCDNGFLSMCGDHYVRVS